MHPTEKITIPFNPVSNIANRGKQYTAPKENWEEFTGISTEIIEKEDSETEG